MVPAPPSMVFSPSAAEKIVLTPFPAVMVVRPPAPPSAMWIWSPPSPPVTEFSPPALRKSWLGPGPRSMVFLPAGSISNCGLDAISRALICPCKPDSSASEINNVATPTARPSIEISDRKAVCASLRAAQR